MESEPNRFIVGVYKRANRNLVILGLPFLIVGLSLVAVSLKPGALPELGAALAWGVILGMVGLAALGKRIFRGSAEAAIRSQASVYGMETESLILEMDEGIQEETRIEFKNIVVAGRWVVVRRTFSAVFSLRLT